jgi:predicted Zn-dependent peptidase
VQNYLLTQLDGGTRVISEPLPSIRSAAIGLWIGTGSRDEDDGRAGVTHFLEHLLFKGSRTYSAQEIAEIFDTFGGELNAATARDYTVVYGRVLDDHVERALDVMTDMVFVPILADLDSEREVVLEEIAMIEDSPQELVHDLITQAVFGNHPLGRPVLGSADVIASVSRRSVAAYHRARYTAANVVVAAAGSIDHERLLALVERTEKKLREPPARRPAARAAFVAPPGPSLRFQRKDTEQYHVCLGAPGLARDDERRFALRVLDNILGGTSSSRLFQEVREKRGLAYSVYSFQSTYAGTGQVGLYLGTRPDNVVRAMKVVADELARLREDPASEDELARSKENVKGRVVLSLESTTARMNRLGASVLADMPLLSVDEVIEKIDAVTLDDVAALARELFAADRLSAAGIGADADEFRRALEPISPALVGEAVA